MVVNTRGNTRPYTTLVCTISVRRKNRLTTKFTSLLYGYQQTYKNSKQPQQRLFVALSPVHSHLGLHIALRGYKGRSPSEHAHQSVEAKAEDSKALTYFCHLCVYMITMNSKSIINLQQIPLLQGNIYGRSSLLQHQIQRKHIHF